MSKQTTLTRRSALALAGAALGAAALPRTALAAPIEKLALYGPPAGPSITLAHAVSSGAFAGIANEATMTAWRNPDELRAGLTSGEILLSVVPVQAAANLYNRGFPIRLANAMTNGLLYILSDKPELSTVSGLKGMRIAVPFRGDTPEIIFGQLLRHHGLDAAKDLEITYTGTPIEAMQMMLAGRVDAALTAEPSTTAGILKGKKAGKTIRRAINIQQEWGAMTGKAPVVPQAGLAVTLPFLDAHGDALPAIHAVLEQATAAVLADPKAAAAAASTTLGMPAPLLAASVPSSNLVTRAAGEARADIERMLSTMDLKKIGGKLPDDGFYL